MCVPISVYMLTNFGDLRATHSHKHLTPFFFFSGGVETKLFKLYEHHHKCFKKHPQDHPSLMNKARGKLLSMEWAGSPDDHCHLIMWLNM